MGKNIVFTTLHGLNKEIPVNQIEFRPSVYGVIINGNEVLLTTTRETGKYFIPGGAIGQGETVMDALKREIREETGINVEVGKLVGHDEEFFYYDRLDKAWQVIALIFLCTPKSFELSDAGNEIGDESTNPQWVSIKSLKENQFQVFGKTITEILSSV